MAPSSRNLWESHIAIHSNFYVCCCKKCHNCYGLSRWSAKVWGSFKGCVKREKGDRNLLCTAGCWDPPFLPLVQPYNLWYTALCEVQDTCTLLYQQAFSFFFNGKDTSVIVTHNAAVCVELLLIVEPWESLPHTISWGSHEFREAWIRQTMWKWLHVHPL